MKPRYNFVYEKAAEFLESLQEDFIYPLDFEKIIGSKGWILNYYSHFDAPKYEISIDGYSTYANNNFDIFINIFQPEFRKQFTFGHEVGHVTLNHHLEFKKELLLHDPRVINALEREANCFSRLIITPAEIIKPLTFKTPYLIHEVFNVSVQMAKIRLEWLSRDFERSKFNNYTAINKVLSDVDIKIREANEELQRMKEVMQFLKPEDT